MLRFGCLGAARITPLALVKPVKDDARASISAVASRSAERAEEFARAHGVTNIETDYAALIRRDDVDVIYNALPPHRHSDLTIMALEAGKPVLCEKPMAMNAGQAQAMADAARETGVFLMEAFHYRFHPAFAQVCEIVHGGDLGRIQSYKGVFNVEIPEREGELRHESAVGGGALMDLGCYPLHWARSLLEGEPEIISAKAIEGRAGIDLTMSADMVFDGGVKARLETSMAPKVERAASLEIVGSEATLKMVNPLAPHLGHQILLKPEHAEEPIIVAEEEAGGLTTYHHQLDHFINCLNGEAEPILPPEDGVANMMAIDAIYRAAGMSPRGEA